MVNSILDDLVNERGLVDWRVESVQARGIKIELIYGRVIISRLDEQRELRRKRKNRSSTISHDAENERCFCVFIVLCLSSQPTLSFARMTELHDLALIHLSSNAVVSSDNRIYLCLTDAAQSLVSYYRLDMNTTFLDPKT